MNRYPRVFLFGAGASFGAGQIDPRAPPLGCRLYNELARSFPHSWGQNGKLGKRYADALRTNFEQAMFDEVNRWEPAISVLDWYREMALYFLPFSTDDTGLDLYSRLLRFLYDRGELSSTAFASLNYECVFERAVQNLGMEVVHQAGQIRTVLTACGRERIERYPVMCWYDRRQKAFFSSAENQTSTDGIRLWIESSTWDPESDGTKPSMNSATACRGNWLRPADALAHVCNCLPVRYTWVWIERT